MRWGLRPHYPAEAALLEPFPSYGSPPPLAPLGEGLLGLLLDPLDQWGLQQQQQLQRGSHRRQNPAYSRLLYLRRRLLAEGWQQLPPSAPGWRPHPSEVGLSRGELQRRLTLIPSRDTRDPTFRRHRYLRHGSLLLLGVAAPATQARCWARRLAAEASAACGQPLPPPRLRSSSAPLLFRGFRLRCAPPGAGGTAAPRRGRRRCTPRLSLRLPTSRLAALLGRGGLLSWGGEGIGLRDLLEGRSPHGWQSGVNRSLLRHGSNQLLRAFGEALSTTAAYYRGVDNAPQLLRLLRRLRGTLLRSLACRYRLEGHQLEGC